VAADWGRSDVVRLLLQRNAAVDAADKMKETPLFLAVGRGHLGVVKLLLDAEADPNAKDLFEWTPLRAAAWGGHTRAAELLLANKADVHANFRGWTALHEAVKQGCSG